MLPYADRVPAGRNADDTEARGKGRGIAAHRFPATLQPVSVAGLRARKSCAIAFPDCSSGELMAPHFLTVAGAAEALRKRSPRSRFTRAPEGAAGTADWRAF